MSDESELNRLRADLEKFASLSLRYRADVQIRDHQNYLRNKIAELEAAADPWRKAIKVLERLRGNSLTLCTDHSKTICDYVDHLTAEVARLTERVGELEAGIKAEDDSDVLDAEYTLKHGGFVPFEGPIVGLEPVLDPARVLATAAEVMQLRGYRGLSANLFGHAKDAKPYPLKKGGE